MTRPKSRPEAAGRLWLLYALLVMVVGLWVIYWLLLERMIPNPTLQGLFGDSFGAANALFSALAFAGLIYTVLLQREELALQRQELGQTRMELQGQKLQLEAQNATMRLQSFENTFFQMLRLHHDIVEGITYSGSSRALEGRRAFVALYSELQLAFKSTSDADPTLMPPEHVERAYEQMFEQCQQHLGHYFRNLYHLVKLIDRSPIEEKHRYTSLLRAQLSSYEHVLLFYNGVSSYGKDKFKPLIEEYALLENMPRDLLINEEHHVPLYDVAAYGDDGVAVYAGGS